MRSFTKTLALLFIAGCSFTTAFSQSAEKIHVHFDKDIYLPGETVWFKAYIFDAGRPTLSTNLYAGWYNKDGKLLKEKRYPVYTGTANGDFDIPDSLPDAVYQLRLFTKKMQQGDNSHVFVRSVAVYQSSAAKAASAPVAGNTILSAYPEGGSLVAGISNYVAFKTTTEGTAAPVTTAALTDADGKLVDSIFFDGTGMAKLQFTPKQATRYFVKWTGADGQQQSTALPSPEMNGATLHTELTAKDLYYSIQKNNSIPRFNTLHISLSAGKDILYSAQLNMEKTAQAINKLPVDSLPAGLVDIALTDEDGNTLQKKSVFIKSKITPPVITVIERSSQPKGKNVIDITVNDTTVSLLSLSIVDELFYPTSKNSIVDDLLLSSASSDLYNSMGDTKKADLVVQTSGLKYPLQNYTTAPVDNYLSLLAYLDRSKSLPDKASLTLIATDKVAGRQVFSLLPGKEKNFASTGLVVYDSAKLYYQLSEKDLSRYVSLAEISNIQQPASIRAAQNITGIELRKFTALAQTSFDNYASNKPAKFNDVRTLKDVEVKGKKKNSYMARLQELDDRYASGTYKGLGRGEAFNVLEDPMADGYYDVFSYLAGKVAGVTVNRSSFGGTITSSRGVGGGEPLALFIDQTSATWDMLATLPLSQVAYIKVINGIVLGDGFRSTTGAIYIYTRKGNDIKITTPPMPSIVIKGYDMPKEFLNPDYSEKQSLLNKDYRSTLYWNPYIETSSDNQTIRIEYYNNDVSKKPVLTLKGFNEEGEVVEVRKVLE